MYNALGIILASTYIFSGLHKLNGGFLYSIWEQMILKKFFGFKISKNIIMHYSGLLLPIIEITAGVLLFSKFRRYAGIVLIGMHLTILALLGPSGNNYNIIVWPWNLAMILFTYVIFIQINTNTSFTLNRNDLYSKVVILFWIILPVLSFADLWEQYFSSSLYSGKSKNMAICVSGNNKYEILDIYTSKNDKHKLCNGNKLLSVHDWAIKELKVPPYPEEWYYRKLLLRFEDIYPEADAAFSMYSYPYEKNIILK